MKKGTLWHSTAGIRGREKSKKWKAWAMPTVILGDGPVRPATRIGSRSIRRRSPGATYAGFDHAMPNRIQPGRYDRASQPYTYSRECATQRFVRRLDPEQ